jgi:thiamine-phosphate pyrophosphorylase
MGTLDDARAKLARVAARLNARNGRGLPALVLMTDDARQADWAAAVSALPAGAAVIVRHRDARKREALARSLRGPCAARRIRLLIADDAHLAQRVRADGVHVPQRRVHIIERLRATNRRWLVTASAHGAASVLAARRQGADAVLVAPVFATLSHPGRASLGVLRLAALARGAPAYALGGIDAQSVQRLAGASICGIALIGGWVGV